MLAESSIFDPAYWLQYGAIGLFLLWLMSKVEPRLRSMENTILLSTRASLIIALSDPLRGDRAKEEMRDTLMDVNGTLVQNKIDPNTGKPVPK